MISFSVVRELFLHIGLDLHNFVSLKFTLLFYSEHFTRMQTSLNEIILIVRYFSDFKVNSACDVMLLVSKKMLS